jgi:hypothetical protein
MVSLPQDSQLRKEFPVVTGVLDYFPEAIATVAFVSYAGNQKHNPGEPLHWSRDKSADQDDCIGRHTLERGGFDMMTVNGRDVKVRHSALRAWRALAALQLELEAAAAKHGITIAELLEREWNWKQASAAELPPR